MTSLSNKLVEKAQRKLKAKDPNFDISAELLNDYCQDAINIIVKWRKLNINKPQNELLQGLYDTEIVNFVIESYNMIGLEGQSSDNSLGNSKVFRATPETNLKSSIKQVL